ncbi:MAG TPA: hypothetical protein VHG08_06180 [Longimicrobium sp.]|nr:hypothetical protein [Longimicrobium sp.]
MQLPDGERIKLGFELVRDLSTQLITLATGVIALTIASAERGMLHHVSRRARRAARIGWICCLASAIAGVMQIMFLTGALLPEGGATEPLSEVPAPARLMGEIQIITFLLGLLALIVFASKALGRTTPANTDIQTHQPGPRLPLPVPVEVLSVSVAKATTATPVPELETVATPHPEPDPETTPDANPKRRRRRRRPRRG